MLNNIDTSDLLAGVIYSIELPLNEEPERFINYQ